MSTFNAYDTKDGELVSVRLIIIQADGEKNEKGEGLILDNGISICVLG